MALEVPDVTLIEGSFSEFDIALGILPPFKEAYSEPVTICQYGLALEIQQLAPGLKSDEEVKALQTLNPRKISMYEVVSDVDNAREAATLVNLQGNMMLHGFLFFKRTELSRSSGEWLHGLVGIRIGYLQDII